MLKETTPMETDSAASVVLYWHQHSVPLQLNIFKLRFHMKKLFCKSHDQLTDS